MNNSNSPSTNDDSGKSAQEIEAALMAQLNDLDDGVTDTGPTEAVSEEVIWAETAKAAKITSEAMLLAKDIFQKIKKKQSVEIGPIVKVTRQMLSSFSRDQEALTSLALLKHKDNHAFVHSVNVSIYMLALARKMNFTEQQQVWISLGGLLQDIGLSKLPKDIFLKKGKLTTNERKFVQQHVDFGMHSLESMEKIPEIAKNIMSHHHERMDGSGYPRKIKGSAISKEGRMSAIVDSFAAITSKRSYRKQLDNYVALRTMLKLCGSKYDAEIFQAFIQCVGVFPVGSTIKLVNGTVCVVVRNHDQDLLHPIVRPIVSSSGDELENKKLLDLKLFKTDKNMAVFGHVAPGTVCKNPSAFLPNQDAYK
jgi:HD-GYP domain-containing protein (c-di-GMP phosphodiesterase class II)